MVEPYVLCITLPMYPISLLRDMLFVIVQRSSFYLVLPRCMAVSVAFFIYSHFKVTERWCQFIPHPLSVVDTI